MTNILFCYFQKNCHLYVNETLSSPLLMAHFGELLNQLPFYIEALLSESEEIWPMTTLDL